MGKKLIVKEFNGEGRVRDATYVEFERTFGFHQGRYRVQLADKPSIPFGEKKWERSWYKEVVDDSILLTHHTVRTPEMLLKNTDCETLIMKLDQGSMRKNFNKYGWYERVYVDSRGNVDEYEIEEDGKKLTLQVPRILGTMKYRNVLSGVIEHELNHTYIANEALLKRVWTPPDHMCIYIEYCISTEVWYQYARQYNEWNQQIRFLDEELGLEEVCICVKD